jgi:tetratricopeptide (TPR) repeat protein
MKSAGCGLALFTKTREDKMKSSKLVTLSLVGVGVLSIGALTLRSVLKSKTKPVVSPAETTTPSKVDQRILRARQAIDKMPDSSDGYNQLAAAYMQKARETANFDYNASADEALTRSLAVEPDNYDALKLRSKLQLTYHRFADALETARRAQNVRVDDHDVWGQITDALVELGEYPAAVRAAQKMVDLRPDSSAYARVSYLRELHGGTNGAIQAMTAAVKAANPNDPEGVAWCRTQLGNELMNVGNLEAAEREFDKALLIFADHHLALQGKARALMAGGDLQGAARIYEQQQSKTPSADAALALGDLYMLLGREDAAKTEYQQFESLERKNAALERSYRHMFNYWLDHDLNLGEALIRATSEYDSRKDIFTCDSLAWALFKNGRVEEAKDLINRALRTGTKDARINYHAGMIYKTLNIRDRAAQHLQLGAALNSSFDPLQAETAKKMLAELE